MSPRRALPLLPLVLALAAGPALAGADSDAAAPLPTACNGSAPVLRDGQTLETRTAYFHGTSRLGDQDEQLLLGTALKMDAVKPTTGDTKVKTSKPGVLGNDAFSKNGVNGFWQLDLTEPTQIVCAATTVHAVAPGNAITAQVRVDIAAADTATPPNATTSTTAAAGNGPRPYSGSFGRLGKEGVLGFTDVTVQFAPPAPGAALLYDSTSALSSFTYVVAVPAFVPEEPAE